MAIRWLAPLPWGAMLIVMLVAQTASAQVAQVPGGAVQSGEALSAAEASPLPEPLTR